MNKWILRLLAGVAVTQAGAAVAHQNSGIAADEEAWGRAASLNTLEAYAKFSMEFPESGYARQARSRLATLNVSGAEVEAEALDSDPDKTVTPEFVPTSIMVV